MHPDEIEELVLKVRGDKFAKSLRNFFNYLGITDINGYDLDR